MNASKALWKASAVFAPSFPRQSSNGATIQGVRYSRGDFCAALEQAMENGMPGYYSVYSYPRGHSRDGNIPKVDCIFIDLDVDKGKYDPDAGKTDISLWRQDMSALLARSRMIAREIIKANQESHFRAVLSGHKGLHLYLDFPTIAPENGDFNQFKNGLREYGEQVMSWLDATAGGVNIEKWVDVDASDLGRLARHPNTIHHGAEYDNEERWCVPVTIEELSELTVDDYLDLTSEPRWLDSIERNPSDSAGDKVVQAIRSAGSSHRSKSTGSTYNPAVVREYDEKANDDIELADLEFLTANKPCINAFRNRDDAFDHGNASHTMEISIIARFVEMNVPRDVIHEFFAEIPGYDERYTDEQITKIIGRTYKEFNCQSIADRAPEFCLGDQCSVYRRSDDIQLS